MSDRIAELTRKTGESDIRVRVNIDGQGRAEIDTPVGFMNHMLQALAKHSMIDLSVTATGDMETGSHHTAEDTAIVLGRCIAEALGDCAGIVRMSSKHVPLDEALTHAVVDLGGRGYPVIDIGSTSNYGDFSPDMARHFFETLALRRPFQPPPDGATRHERASHDRVGVQSFPPALYARPPPRIQGPQGAVPSTKGTLSS